MAARFIPSDAIVAQLRGKALSRLYKDWKEVVDNPFETIQVFPVEKNFFEWHIVLSAPKSQKKKVISRKKRFIIGEKIFQDLSQNNHDLASICFPFITQYIE